MASPLTNTAIVNAKPRAKPYKLADGEGLFLFVTPAGGKLWRMKYRFGGKEKLLSFGAYPIVSLADARRRKIDARRLLAEGTDPSAAKREEKIRSAVEALTFATVAEEWFAKWKAPLAKVTVTHTRHRLDRFLFPDLGTCAIREIGPRQVLDALRKVEGDGHAHSARRALQTCGQVFRYAVASGYVDSDPTRDLRGVLTAETVTHQASITDPTEVAGLLRAIWDYRGAPTTAIALRLSAMFFVRPGELRHAEWAEVDLDAAEWRIAAAKMKMREKHIVPLARQAVELLQDLRKLTGSGRYLFPSERSTAYPMSENTITAALRRMGYSKDEMCAHGFRSMASTLLNEQGWNRDAIERQLAHAERNSVRAAYNYAEFLPERRKMMQAYADHLDTLRLGSKTTAASED